MATTFNRFLIMDYMMITLALIFSLVIYTDARQDKTFCNVCRAVVEEANWKISQSDQSRTIQVGSFRVDPQGNQDIKEKTYARSESHVEEIFESICDQLHSYAEMKQDDGTTTVVRTRGRHGRELQIDNYNLDMTSGKRLGYQCQNFLEDHEEVVMASLQREDVEDYELLICGRETAVCPERELRTPLLQLPEVTDEDKSETEEEPDFNMADTEEGDLIADNFEDLMDQEEKDEL